MRLMRTTWLVLLLMLGIGALSASSAAAETEYPGWVLNEIPLGSGETVAFTATSSTALTLESTSLGIVLSAPAGNCTITGSLRGASAEAPDEIENALLSCSGATVKTAEANCKVHSVGEAEGVLKSGKLKGTLAWLGSTGFAVGTILKPATGTEVMTAVIEKKTGKTCALSGSYLISHEVIPKFLPTEPEAESETPELSFPTTPTLAYWNNASPRVEQKITQLTLGAKTATLAATFLMQLPPGRRAAARPKGTVLCKKLACAGNAYAAGKVLQGNTVAENAKLEFGAATIKCGTSLMEVKNEVVRSEPLKMQLLTLTFGTCKIKEGMLAEQACPITVQTFAKMGATLRSIGNLRDGDFGLGAVKLEFNCGVYAGRNLAGCGYERNADVTLRGGGPETVNRAQFEVAVTGMTNVVTTGECPAEITWKGNYILQNENFYVQVL